MRFFLNANAVLFFILSACLCANAADSPRITAIEFKETQSGGRLLLKFSGHGSFRTLRAESGKLLVLEAKGFDIPANLTKVIDLSSGKSPVLQITPYKSGSGKNQLAKIVIRMREAANHVASELSDRFVLEFTGGSSSMAGGQKLSFATRMTYDKRRDWSESDSISNIHSAESKGSKYKNIKPESLGGLTSKDLDLESYDRKISKEKEIIGDPEKMAEVSQKLIEVLNSTEEPKKYFGDKVSFASQNANVIDIFRLVGRSSGLNIVADSDVGGVASYDVKDIPWDQLLDIAMTQSRLKAVASGNVIRILKQDTFYDEQDKRIRQMSIVDSAEPIVMAVIPLSYITGAEVKKMIDALLVSPKPTAENPNTFILPQSFAKGKVEIDDRSNSLIVTNTKGAIDRIRRLIKEIDVALPQVLIDAKIVVAQESFAKSLGVTYGGRMQSTSGRAGAGLGMLGSTTSIGANSDTGGSFSVSSPNNGLGFGVQLGSGPNANLNATLQLAESNGVSRTVASPRVIVNNKKSATITDGQKIFITSTTTVGGTTTTSTTPIDAGLSMSVTPQVTSAGSVLLSLNVSKALPNVFNGATSADSKSINTEVLVDSGNTLVLGGVYQFIETKSEDGIPMLKDLPFIGQLFRTNNSATTKQELMVFVTPQIMEPTGTAPIVKELEEKATM